MIDEYKETFANPYRAAALGYIDDVINPNETRKKLCLALNMLMDKQENRPERKHGNIPLWDVNMTEIEKSKIAAITAVLIHVNRGENYNQKKNQNIWAFEHRRKIMGLRGVREMKSSRTTWRWYNYWRIWNWSWWWII